ncbi:MAG TPA: response regulator [Chloroflexi bacterium]|nr:response regulator [Chloroflexota bacterium]
MTGVTESTDLLTNVGVIQQKRVVVVDDEPSSREALCALLTAEDLDIQSLASGKELLRRMPELAPDVILLDVMMPEMDGYAVCYELKQSIAFQHIPIILITALDAVQDRVRGLEVGADEFLTKPVSRLELQARVRTMLRIKTQYDQLERMLELRQALSYMIVHDLRNPLAAVMLYLQLLKRKGSVSPEHMRYLDMATNEAQKMSSFLDDMLMLAKMERGKLSLSRSPLYVDHLLEQVRSKLAPYAEAQGVSLVLKTQGQSYPVIADVALFQRVVENLVANALKFSPPQTTVTIVAEYPRTGLSDETATNLPAVRLSVLDQGRGIPPEDFVRMFDQYEAVHMKEQGKAELGLELAFCRMVAEAHGGRIYAGNNPDRGAVITVEM